MMWTQQRAASIGETIFDKARGMIRRMIHPAKQVEVGRHRIQPGMPWGSWSAGYHPPTMPMPREEYAELVRRTEAELRAQKKHIG